ncbi:unnamed protein product [Soboliphyme baturini]|uniref:GLOBIN domain-containing protein n=1 Tax=Soboliphyme baturini TaxID=241478 RepID=A0A183IPU7_9BILA|nr:unnamed protein product [Soboliphyme baturini]
MRQLISQILEDDERLLPLIDRISITHVKKNVDNTLLQNFFPQLAADFNLKETEEVWKAWKNLFKMMDKYAEFVKQNMKLLE